jgi:hypothetical protein
MWDTIPDDEKENYPRGPWQATGMQKLRMRDEQLKRKADGLIEEADNLLAKAEEIEAAGS